MAATTTQHSFIVLLICCFISVFYLLHILKNKLYI